VTAGMCMVACGGYAFGSTIISRFPVLQSLMLRKGAKPDGA
jgi:hypothetical protein